MAGISAAFAQLRLEEYLVAEAKVLKGQSVTIDGETLTRANLESIRKGIEYWDGKAKELENLAMGRGRGRNLAPGW